MPRARATAEPAVASPRPTVLRTRLVALLATFGLLLGSVAAPALTLAKPPSGGGGGSSCPLVPELRDVTVNQGLGSYARLVRGKETLVRAYLAMPSCAGRGASISLAGGSVTVRNGSTVLGTVGSPTPAPQQPYAPIPPADGSPSLDAPGDPLFVVPGSMLAPASPTGSFTASFTIQVSYVSQASRSDPAVSGSVTFSTMPGSNTAITKVVEQRTNALRVLVVPMGDGSQPYSSQFSSAAHAAVVEGMLTLNRLFPVPDGTGDLGGVSGGVRYSINPTLLPLNAVPGPNGPTNVLGADGLFCGLGSTYNVLKGALASYLTSWNANNPGAVADLVVGVVDGAISKGSNEGCAEGMALMNSPESWVRAIPDQPGTPSPTGALFGMEIGHSLGLVPADRDHAISTSHSPNQAADAGSNRGYNLRLRSFLGDDRTVMTLSGTWNNVTTLTEQLDYAFLLCRLGGSVAGDCASAPTVGSSSGVAAGPRLFISGSTDGTPAGTDVKTSYVVDGEFSTPPADSHYRVEQWSDAPGTGGSLITSTPIAVFFDESSHEHPDEPGSVEPSEIGLISSVIAFDLNANWFGLYHHDELLYARSRLAPPQVDSVTVTPGGAVPYTDSEFIDDRWPAVSPDGDWVAWNNPWEGDVILVGPSSDATAADLCTAGMHPAWSPDGSRIAFVDADGLGLIDVVLDPASEGYPCDSASQVHLHGDYTDNLAHPTWSPDGTHLAFAMNGNIWTLDLNAEGAVPVQLTFGGNDDHPSWSQTAGDDRIAFVRRPFEPIGAAERLTAGQRNSVRASAGRIETAAWSDDDGAPAVLADHDASHFVVNSTEDPGDGECTADHCTLREAIGNAAFSPSSFDSITFAIPADGPHVITLAEPLPPIEESLTIDALTQPGASTGAPTVVLDGSALTGETDHGFQITADGATVRGFVINGFSGHGILIDGSASEVGTEDNAIAANFIGTDVTGTVAVPNGGYGIAVVASGPNTIGGYDGDGNLVSGNALGGILVDAGEPGAIWNDILDNVVGTDLYGDPLGNGGDGILLDGAEGATVTGNSIWFNAGNGITVVGDGAIENWLTPNSIHRNSGLGIDLGDDGVTPNDNATLDADTGPNNLANHPEIAVSDDGTEVSGSVQLDGSQDPETLDFFLSDECDPSGHGEGSFYLGSFDSSSASTDMTGYLEFTFYPEEAVIHGEWVTALIVDEDGSTSEFSNCVTPPFTGPGVWTVDPSDVESAELLIEDADEPAWTADGRILFTRDATIFSIPSVGSGEPTALTEGWADSAATAGGLIGFVRQRPTEGGSYGEIMLLRGAIETVVGASTGGDPEQLRLDLFYQCEGSPLYPIFVGLLPDATDGASASWAANYDPSLACPNGAILAVVNDGFLRSDEEQTDEIVSEPQAPIPTIYAPLDGGTVLQYGNLPLHGGAKDAEDGELVDGALQWFLDGTSVGDGGTLDLSPPDGGWSPGLHEVRLEATDTDGATVAEVVTITVVADADNDGLPADLENSTDCLSDTDPLDAFTDCDGDGINNLDDRFTPEGPLVKASSYAANAVFSPDVLNLPSKGSTVTMAIKLPARNLKTISLGSVAIVNLQGAEVNIPAVGLAVDKKGVLTARFDRQVVIRELTDLGLKGVIVHATVTGASSQGWSFIGIDDFRTQ